MIGRFLAETLLCRAGDTAQWKRQRIGYRRKQRAIWIHYEVGRIVISDCVSNVVDLMQEVQL